MDLKTVLTEVLRASARSAIGQIQHDASTVILYGRVPAPNGMSTSAVKVKFGPGQIIQLGSVNGTPLPAGNYRVVVLISREGAEGKATP